jgi:hypothetical protein
VARSQGDKLLIRLEIGDENPRAPGCGQQRPRAAPAGGRPLIVTEKFGLTPRGRVDTQNYVSFDTSGCRIPNIV